MSSEEKQDCSKSLKTKLTLRNLNYLLCETPKDARSFWFVYSIMLVVLMIIFLVAFLLKTSSSITYYGWYNDSCSIDHKSDSTMAECDRSLRLFCSKSTKRCSCLDDMFWNGSFCDCSPTRYYTGTYCQQRRVFSQPCVQNIGHCMENLICANSTNTCVCPSSSYYNQTDCVPKISYASGISCSLSSQCVDGLYCGLNQCVCPLSQSWNGNQCTNASKHGESCSSLQPCDTSALLSCNANYSRCTCDTNYYWNGKICREKLSNGSSCNNTQQCESELRCISGYCQCSLIYTQYWSSQTLSCELCVGPDLFLFDGICYYVPAPTNTTNGTYSTLSSMHSLTTIKYDYQLNYVFNQHVRVFNWTPIFLASSNPIVNYFQWSPAKTIIKPNYFCNDTFVLTTTGYVLSFQLERNMACLRTWPSSNTGHLVAQLNEYVEHGR